ncbi:predicted protein [Naegleria gruberi]|uniref:Predicted protein n=1 Tax=Naegleria gruberi TaxID=5762 RepID=D2VN01_NAEGR|nr:uncharacterized protein NAEGRDRAFT_70323 [Naegleria gruberi]EFC41910.1 predicted protein [Naegleria gruberi]|eukprot:XP_002674654.1 predicted protein [Naegleria gruberi strain NEG-M]
MSLNGGRKIFKILDHGIIMDDEDNSKQSLVYYIEWDDKSKSWEYLNESLDSDHKIEEYVMNIQQVIKRQCSTTSSEEITIPIQYRGSYLKTKKKIINSEKKEVDLITEWLIDQYHKKANSYLRCHADRDEIILSMINYLMESNNSQPILVVVLVSQIERYKKLLATNFPHVKVLTYYGVKDVRVPLFNNSKKRDLVNPSKFHYTFEICLTTMELLMRDSNRMLEVPWRWCLFYGFCYGKRMDTVSKITNCPILLTESGMLDLNISITFDILHALNSELFSNYENFKEEFIEFPDKAEQLLKPYMWDESNRQVYY